MYFPEDKLFERFKSMPQAGHETVWHLCHRDLHPSVCHERAQVTREIPELPEANLDGLFLMRLHPRAASLEEVSGKLLVRLVEARSYPHATLWSFRAEG